MKIKEILNHGFKGIVITEFIVQSFFVLISILSNQLILLLPMDAGTDLQNYIKHFFALCILGFFYGIGCSHVSSLSNKEETTSKQLLKHIGITSIIMLNFTILVIYIIFPNNPFTFSNIINALTFILLITSILSILFIIAYFIFSAVSAKLEKNLVEEMNKKINESSKTKNKRKMK